MRICLACFCFVISFSLLFACSDPNTQKQGVSCSKDYNCLSNERCYLGRCTDTSEIPNSEPTVTQDAADNDRAQNAPDTLVADNTSADKTVTDDATALNYPPGPYGIDVDEVILPFEMETCDGTKKYKLSDFYKHPTIKVIQLTVHTGWCTYCSQQALGMESFYQQYKEKGVYIWYVLTEDTVAGSGKISREYCSAHVAKYKFTFPGLRDEGSQIMRKFFDRNAVPLNMIITTKDMKIRYKKSGSLPEKLEAIISSYL